MMKLIFVPESVTSRSVLHLLRVVLKETGDGKRERGGFPGGSDGKESACDAGDPGSIPGLGRSPGEGNGYTLQYSCLEISMDRGAWWATIHGVAKSQTWLSN